MKTRDIAMYILGGIITVGFFTVMIMLIISGKNEGTLNLLIGAVITAFATVVGYFFGSSKGSSEKNEILNKKVE